MKIHRRLTEGEADNVWSFYKMVKAKLEPAHGPSVHWLISGIGSCDHEL